MLAPLCRTALALTLAAGVSFCLAAAGGAQALKKMTLVQMHPIMGIGEEVFLYAVPKRLGYFAAEGLDVDIQNSQTGMISAQVLQSDNAQVGTTAAAAIMAVREQGADLAMPAPSSSFSRTRPSRGSKSSRARPSARPRSAPAADWHSSRTWLKSASCPISTPGLRPAPALRRLLRCAAARSTRW